MGGDTGLVVLLYGYATGYAWANSQLEAYGKEPLFCEPKDNAAITPEENIDLLRRYVKANPQFGQLDPGLVLLQAYETKYPCK